MGRGLTGLSERMYDPICRHWLDVDCFYSWPKAMYTEQGREQGEKLWAGTLEELKFAGVGEKL